MTISQLEYVMAVAEHQHFGRAAEAKNIAQSTLSMMIKKLEDELDVQVFDRSKKPIVPTLIGEKVIQQSKHVLAEYYRLEDIVKDHSELLTGSYNLGVIPTIAPYLMPQLIQIISAQYPMVQLHILELQTNEIVDQLAEGKLDAAILATPLHQNHIKEYPLYYEEFLLFGSIEKENELIVPEEIDPSALWLLEEGHCLRAQILNLCVLKNNASSQIQFKSGSLETLIEIVRMSKGLTILPELASKRLSTEDQQLVHRFCKPVPFREISLVTHSHAAKYKFIEVIQDIVEEVIPLDMRKLKKDSTVLEIEKSN